MDKKRIRDAATGNWIPVAIRFSFIRWCNRVVVVGGDNHCVGEIPADRGPGARHHIAPARVAIFRLSF